MRAGHRPAEPGTGVLSRLKKCSLRGLEAHWLSHLCGFCDDFTVENRPEHKATVLFSVEEIHGAPYEENTRVREASFRAGGIRFCTNKDPIRAL